MPEPSGNPHGRQRLGHMALVAWVLATAILCAACQQPATPTAGLQPGISIDEIVADPQRFIGRTVAANGQVARVINERVIVVRSLDSANELVAVLSNQALQSVGPVEASRPISLVGTVEPLTPEEIQQVEQQLGIKLDEQQILSLANQAPLIIAQDAHQ